MKRWPGKVRWSNSVKDDNTKAVEAILDELCAKISQNVGLTLVGNRLTIRWGSTLKQVSMIIDEVEDGEPELDLVEQ